jgi:hypothetical protein
MVQLFLDWQMENGPGLLLENGVDRLEKGEAQPVKAGHFKVNGLSNPTL